MSRGVVLAVILAAITAVSFPAAAKAPKGTCPNLWKMYGVFMRASLLCNFPEGRAIQKTLFQIKQQCSRTSESKARAYIGDGFRQFDKELKVKGHPRACGDMYTFMDAVGG